MRQIEANLQKLTPAQSAIADYIADHREAVAFMTARQLAAEVHQSDAAIARFARAVGYGGFPQLRDALREHLLATHGLSGMQANAAAQAGEKEARRRVGDVSIELISKTVERNSDETYTDIVRSLVKARKIFVSGHGTSYPLAAYLSMHLNQCFDNVQLFNVEHGDLAERFRSVGADVVFIGIGYVRYLPYTVELLEFAKRAGATVVAITDKHSSPLAMTADFTLFAERSDSSVWWSHAGTFTLADTLIAMCIEQEEHTSEHMRKSDEMLKKLGHWDATLTSGAMRGRPPSR